MPPLSSSGGEGLDSANPRNNSLSFAEVLQGFNSLTVAEKQLFMTVISQTDAEVVRKAIPASGGNILPPGAPVPEGHTRDPKTGKVFKLSAKAERSEEFLRLSAAVKTAVDNLRIFDAKVSSKGEDGALVTMADGETQRPPTSTEVEEYARLLRALEVAKTSVAAYKAAHPEEFKPPKNWDPSKAEPRKHVVLPGSGKPSLQANRPVNRGKPGNRGKTTGRGGYATSSSQDWGDAAASGSSTGGQW